MKKHFDYVGWIPCVSGKLFYEYCACGLHHKDGYFSINHTEEFNGSNQRFVILNSEVNWKDTRDKDLSGDYLVTLVAQQNASSPELHGKVFISGIEPPPKKKKPSSTGVDYSINYDFIETTRLELKKIKETADAGDHISQLYADFESYIGKAETGSPDCFEVEFEISDSGITFLNQAKAKNDIPRDSSELFVVARQAFYYLKYSLHKHQHHNIDDDSLTTIHEVPPDCEDIGSILINDLKHGLVEIKRKFTASDFYLIYDTKGIVSYGQSLINSCLSQKLISEEDAKAQQKWFDSTSDSIQAIAEKLRTKRDNAMNASNKARGLVLVILAVLSPWFIVYATSDNAKQYIDELELSYIFGKILSSDVNIIFFIISIVCIYWVDRFFYSRVGGYLNVLNGFGYFLYNLVQSKFKAYFISIVILLLGTCIVFDAFHYTLYDESYWVEKFTPKK